MNRRSFLFSVGGTVASLLTFPHEWFASDSLSKYIIDKLDDDIRKVSKGKLSILDIKPIYDGNYIGVLKIAFCDKNDIEYSNKVMLCVTADNDEEIADSCVIMSGLSKEEIECVKKNINKLTTRA
jgi:hypothetical protein